MCVCRQSEREKTDSKILEEALAALAIQHREKMAVLESELKEDQNKVRGAFERERVSGRHQLFVSKGKHEYLYLYTASATT